ncbi:hypothetical protein [Mucilaginibacter sp.]|uniref:hypothetical protein n=1 Tax=Mucilaginibacter sp. TaxID=1882438 RepID=UPI002624A011|nr:hypothetical protein [Mucilaginibacter sp.]MDB4922126.1 hypothetical protein [Mucilaginibacter sp.]
MTNKDYKGKTYKQFVFIYRFTLLLLVGMGIYYNYTGKTTGGVLYGKYGGSTTVSYGGNGFFIMAAALLFGHFFIWLFTKTPGRDS